jgi:hypothetical protein
VVLSISNASEQERENVWFLNVALSTIYSKLDAIEAALKLFDFCDERVRAHLSQGSYFENPEPKLLHQWQMIAARDSALRVMDFEESLHSANGYLKGCPLLIDRCDRSHISRAFALLNEYFPHRGAIRNAAGHTVDQLKNHTRRAKHSCGAFVISDSLADRKYTATWDGNLVSHEVSRESYYRLREVAEEFLSSFPKSSD